MLLLLHLLLVLLLCNNAAEAAATALEANIGSLQKTKLFRNQNPTHAPSPTLHTGMFYVYRKSTVLVHVFLVLKNMFYDATRTPSASSTGKEAGVTCRK